MSLHTSRLLRMQAMLLKPRCILCDDPGMPGPPMDLCAGCYRELPRLLSGCEICARPVTDQGLICGSCQKNPPPFIRVIAPYRYAWPIDKMIQQFKFGGDLAMGRVLGCLLARHLASVRPAGASAVVVPVPLHRRRLWQRGFNQAIEVARALTLFMPITVHRDLCTRVRDTPAQVGKHADERQRNLRHAFSLRNRAVPGQVVILDDVMTTGSTCAELARTLKKRGCGQVLVWCLARA